MVADTKHYVEGKCRRARATSRKKTKTRRRWRRRKTRARWARRRMGMRRGRARRLKTSAK